MLFRQVLSMSAELGQAVNEVVAAHRSAVRPSHLARHWLLSVLDQQVLERLPQVMQTCAFQPGDVIADFRKPCHAFYIVVFGSDYTLLYPQDTNYNLRRFERLRGGIGLTLHSVCARLSFQLDTNCDQWPGPAEFSDCAELLFLLV